MEWRRQFALMKPYRNQNVTVTRTFVKLSHKVKFHEGTAKDKAPVVLLHGLFGWKRNFEGISKTLMNITQRAIITADLRNHGDSPHHPTHNYKALAEDVEELLKYLKVTKSVLIGHSMGGRTAMTLALTKPDLVAGLIIIDISPVSNCSELSKDMRKVTQTMAQIDFTKVSQQDVLERNIRQQLNGLVKDEQIKKSIISNIAMSSRGFGWKCNMKALMENYDNILELQHGLGKYVGPTLFIGGQQSPYIPADDLTRIRDLFPEAVLTFVPEAGHIVHANQLKSFLEMVIAFLNQND